MNYPQAKSLLDERQEARIELGLDRVREHLARLGRPQEAVPAIHVAGTNGKGSTCAILESVLRAMGLKTGLYTSPHLIDVRERIAVSGEPITGDEFARHCEKALAADSDRRLTYFELLTAVAFLQFAEKKVDVAVLETGLGGRLDATNVIEKPLAGVITSIDFDHTQHLGTTLRSIASEKAGIIKPGCPAVCGPLPAEALAAVREKTKAPRVAETPWELVSTDWEGNGQELLSRSGIRARLSLLGRRQRWNVAVAEAALDAAGFKPTPAQWRAGLEQVRWPGRFEVRRLDGKIVVLDGAHNPDAMRAFRATWEDSPFSRGRARFLIGLLKDKDAAGVLAELPAGADRVAVAPRSPRALAVSELAKAAQARPAASGAAAFEEWLADPSAPEVLAVCGSFYLVGEILEALERRSP
jgi:dihydrofolate synthase / folylpolyglutamate synthase